jgi:hypothetical protein
LRHADLNGFSNGVFWRGVHRDVKDRVLCVKFSKGGHGLAVLSGLAKVGFFDLPEVVHIEVAVGFEPVLVGLDG